MMTRVAANRTDSEAFSVNNGVNQGWTPVLTPSSLMLSALIMGAYREERPEIDIGYRINGQLLNIRPIQARTRIPKTIIHGPLFEDDCVLNTTTGTSMRRRVGLLASGCTNFGSAIDTEKAVLMHQRASNSDYNGPLIHVNGGQPASVEKLAQPVSQISNNAMIDDKVAHWISKASQILGGLQGPV
ncbi:hypothetical protein SprV_0501962700 [Sparganum proliferum]